MAFKSLKYIFEELRSIALLRLRTLTSYQQNHLKSTYFAPYGRHLRRINILPLRCKCFWGQNTDTKVNRIFFLKTSHNLYCTSLNDTSACEKGTFNAVNKTKTGWRQKRVIGWKLKLVSYFDRFCRKVILLHLYVIFLCTLIPFSGDKLLAKKRLQT